MKHLIAIAFILFTVPACHNNAKTPLSEKDSAAALAITDEMDNRLDQMKSLTPLSADQIRSMFPEELEGMKLSEYTPINNEGYETGEADYKSDDGKELYVTIFDCVGEAGVGKYNLMYLSSLNTDSKDDDGYKKTINFHGDKAIETYDKNDDRYTILLTAKKRLLIRVEGGKTTLDEVKEVVSHLNLATN
jgi:hypothetical protein